MISLDFHTPLFSMPMIEWGENEKNFIYWLRFYNTHVYSFDAEDRPAANVIRYNALMDDFVEKKLYKEKQEAKKEKRNSGSSETYNVG